MNSKTNFKNLFKPEKKSWWQRIKNFFFPKKTEESLYGVDFIYISEPTREQYVEYYNRVKSGESIHSLKKEHLKNHSKVITFEREKK